MADEQQTSGVTISFQSKLTEKWGRAGSEMFLSWTIVGATPESIASGEHDDEVERMQNYLQTKLRQLHLKSRDSANELRIKE